MDLRGKRVGVIGAGVTGLAVAEFAHHRGASVVLNDTRDPSSIEDERRKRLEVCCDRLVFAPHDLAILGECDLVVLSPGIPPHPVFDALNVKNVPVVGEIELASWYLDSKVVGITGTNGKSTVTSLVGDIVQASGRPTFVGGNLGRPMIEAVNDSANRPDGIAVIELSSFQLERIERFHADVAILLNISPDHLDRYDSFEGYAAAKARIFETQTSNDVALVPDGDDALRALASRGSARVRTFGDPAGLVRVVNGAIRSEDGDLEVRVDDIRLVGAHNLSNVCAAALATIHLGIDSSCIEKAITAFRGLGHRMEWVTTIDGVRFVDDSKATNVGATVAALRGLRASDGRVVLIAGGRHKGSDYLPIVAEMQNVGRAVVVLGEAAGRIKKDFSASKTPLDQASDMVEAIRLAKKYAQPGDTVLLAPACSSFDMYASYAARGDAFQQAVRSLEKAS